MLQEGVPDLLLVLRATDHHRVARILEHIQVSRVVLVDDIALCLGSLNWR